MSFWFLLAVSGASAAQTDPVPTHCATQVLAGLGWRFLASTGDTFTVAAGTPCQRASLAEAHAAGDLVVHMPAAATTSPQFQGGLTALLQHPATVCAYAFDLGDATRRAVDRLVANPGFRFSALQLGWIGFGAGGAARDGWERIYSFGRGYRPIGRNSAAIAGFYRGHVRAECGVGRQIAQYATQAELYGPAAFDAEFDADEIVIGTFNKLRRTRSILIGSQAGAMTADGRARKTAAQGRQAFAGLPGFIYHVFDRSTLDDINNQAENFVVYDVSAAAADALRTHDGFEYYNERSRELWALARTLAMDGHRVHEKLLYERDPALRRSLSPAAQATVARLDTLLADPFFREFRIYVHRQGIRPVGFHIVRLLDRNPRTPFRIELALHNLHTTLFERYLAHRLAECERGTATTTAPDAIRLRP
ncbi:hypothetical protein ACFOLC_05280 [Lysobacter cavernae]|uniref:Uncharacterized protein n=1 Tax=Lysobacter cavernae TaxID=1685901 RepID=A0ABV7RNU1_9GAMM